MSWGGILGGIAGGIIGFFVGGPMGAVYGFGLGAGLGMMVDPITPDMPTIGAPDPQSQAMSSTIGGVVPDLCGTAKITGHLLAYGKERNEEITETQEVQGGKGGGGGSQTQTYVVGHRYYMTWVLGICTGPVNTLYTVFKEEDVVWEGELNLADAVNGQETITLEGMGSCTFYFGTSDQVLNSTIEEIIPNPDYNTPYRNFCYAVMDDCYIGDYPRTPTLKFVITKIPEFDFSIYNSIQKYDCNPMHTSWYILTELIGIPSEWLHTIDFRNTALILREEYKGISILFNKQQEALTYIETINSHIDNVLLFESDGLLHPKLFRDNYVIDSIPSVNENFLLEQPTFNRASWSDTLNEIKVQYTELLAMRNREPRLVLSQAYAFGFQSYCGVGYWGSSYQSYYMHPVSFNMKAEKSMIGSMSNAQGTIFINDTGRLMGCGYNYHGGFGGGDNGAYPDDLIMNSYRPLAEYPKWISCSASNGCVAAIRDNGTLWVSGMNSHGQLGTGHNNVVTSWINIGSATSWKEVYFCGNTMFVLDTSGFIWCAGVNNSGIMGLGYDGGGRNTLGKWQDGLGNDMPSGFSKLGGTDTTACHFQGLGDPWVCGSNSFGQLMLGPITIDNPSVYLKPTKWLHNKGVVSMYDYAFGVNNIGFVNTTGQLWVSGRNLYGQLGNGSYGSGTEEEWGFRWSGVGYTQIAMGEFHIIGLKDDGTLWGTGYNGFGQLSFSDLSTYVTTPTQMNVQDKVIEDIACNANGTFIYVESNIAGYPIVCGLNSSNKFGFNGDIDFPYRIEENIYASVQCNVNNSMYLDFSDNLWVAGENTNGQLGLGHYNDQLSSHVQSGTSRWIIVKGSGGGFSVGLKLDGTPWTAGRVSLSGGTSPNNQSTFIPCVIKGTETVISDFCIALHVKEYKTFLITEYGQLFAAGYNSDGNLGLGEAFGSQGTYGFTQVGTDSNWAKVGGGYDHSFFIKEDGTAYCCGKNDYGQLGFGDYITRWEPTLIEGTWKRLTGTEHSSIGIKTDGTLWATGWNRYGQLGTGDYVDSSVWQQIGTDSDWAEISCGNNHIMLTKNNKSVWGLGNNNRNQCFQYWNSDDTANSGINYNKICNPIVIEDGATYKQISCGNQSSIGLRDD